MPTLLGYVSGVRAETRVLTPNPLSKDGEGAYNSPSPYLGKGPGDGEDRVIRRQG